MIPAILFFLVLIAPPLFLAVWRGKRFEESIALTTGSMILFMFLCGILGILKFSVYAILGASAALLILSAVRIIQKKTPLKSLAPFATPAALAFLLVYIFLLYVHYERMLHEWDEFTHWGDVVKAMCHIDDFSTSPLSHSLFQNYVPGMALFQYLFEKIAMIFPGGIFVDWRLYFAYHLLAFIFLLLFLTVRRWRWFLPAFLLILFAAMAPSFLSEGTYLTSIYIDGFVGLLAGAGFAMLFRKEPSKTKTAHILVICALLVLAKDVGMLFAVTLGIAFLLTELLRGHQNPKSILMLTGFTAAAVALPKILWTVNVRMNRASSLKFTNTIDFGVLWRVITGKETGAVAEIPGRYFQRLTAEPIGLEGTFRVNVTYPVIAAVLLGLLLLVWIGWRKANPAKKTRYAVAMIAMIAVFVIYMLGMPLIYMFKFGAPDVNLPSFDRYISIVFSCGSVMVFLLLAVLAQERPKWMTAAFGVCAAVGLLTVNPVRMQKYVTRQDIDEYYNTPRFYSGLVDAMNDLAAGEEKHVWIICQETTGFEYWPIRYGIRPSNAELGAGWSLSAKSNALYPGDQWSMRMTAEEWREKLKEFDHVLIYKASASFREDYGSLFRNPEDIEDNTIFAVNHETGLLERVWTAGTGSP